MPKKQSITEMLDDIKEILSGINGNVNTLSKRVDVLETSATPSKEVTASTSKKETNTPTALVSAGVTVLKFRTSNAYGGNESSGNKVMTSFIKRDAYKELANIINTGSNGKRFGYALNKVTILKDQFKPFADRMEREGIQCELV